MISTVRARTNHYEVLGLKPTASDEEIARAFAREIKAFRPSALGGLVDVSLAYETLRDPARRRAYDASIGVKPEPVRPQLYAATARWSGTFVGATLARPMHDILPARPPAPPAPPQAATRAKPEPPAEPDAAPFIAESPPEAEPPRPLEPPRPREPVVKVEPHVRDRSTGHVELRLHEAEHRTVEWKRPATIVGVPVAAVVLLGAVLGMQAGKGEEQPQVTTALPPPKPRPLAATASPTPEPSYTVVEAQPRRSQHAVRIKHSRAAPAPSDDPLAAQPEPSQVAESAAEPAAAADAPAVETGATMPLPKAVIARTIHRIGYACGQVASTSAVEGSAGAYNVTCTSGATYQAKPVRGRYHFRRVGSR